MTTLRAVLAGLLFVALQTFAVTAAPAENRASGSASDPNNLIGIEARLSEEAVRENAALGYDFASDDAVAARGTTESLYHYGFSRNADSILKEGLQPGIGSGKVFTTPSGGLSPLQAQIDLALPPNRGLSDALFEIDASALRRMGVEIPSAQPVGRSFNMPGGGSEVIFQHPIPPEVIRRVR